MSIYCFLVIGLLDIARKTYTEIVDDLSGNILAGILITSLNPMHCLTITNVEFHCIKQIIPFSVNGTLINAFNMLSPDLVQQMSGTYNLPLKVAYSSARGFHIQMYAGGAEAQTQDSLPGIFIKVAKCKNTLSFTTSDMVSGGERVINQENIHFYWCRWRFNSPEIFENRLPVIEKYISVKNYNIYNHYTLKEPI